MRKGSGLANWNVFRQKVLEVTKPELDAHRPFPGRRRMQQLGYQNLVSSAYHHHGGWAAVRVQLGFRFIPRKPKPKPVSNRAQYKRNPQHRVRVLKNDYAHWTRWLVLPPVNEVLQRHPGLAAYYQRERRSWFTAVEDYESLYGIRLLTGPYGRRQRRYCLAVLEALTFYRHNGRWPRASECSAWLRNWRFGRRQTWHDCLTSINVDHDMMSVLRVDLKEHIRQMQLERSPVLQHHLLIVNEIIIAHNRGPTPATP